MIARIWHGWTALENAPIYESLLRDEVFPSIEAKNKDLQAVKDFVGEEYERSYVPPKARLVLSRYDEKSQHYEITHEIIHEQ